MEKVTFAHRPKIGDLIPFIPMFARPSALGSLAGATLGIIVVLYK